MFEFERTDLFAPRSGGIERRRHPFEFGPSLLKAFERERLGLGGRERQAVRLAHQKPEVIITTAWVRIGVVLEACGESLHGSSSFDYSRLERVRPKRMQPQAIFEESNQRGALELGPRDPICGNGAT